MQVGKLNVERRASTGKGIARRLRTQGLIPGVCYGPMLEAPLPISLDLSALEASFDPEKGHNTVIDVSIREGEKTVKNITMMLKSFQIDHLKQVVTHVDLVAIDTEKLVEADVPVILVGKHKGVIKGGQLHVVRHEVRVRCKPADIPTKIDLDISELDIGGVIHIADLPTSDTVVYVTSARLTVVTCTAPTIEEEKTVAATTAEGTVAAPAEEKGGEKDKKK